MENGVQNAFILNPVFYLTAFSDLFHYEKMKGKFLKNHMNQETKSAFARISNYQLIGGDFK